MVQAEHLVQMVQAVLLVIQVLAGQVELPVFQVQVVRLA
jgi:hypothetical protein